jgi:LuxR family transcriptional regulator, maltose regulon positive regulatory protein
VVLRAVHAFKTGDLPAALAAARRALTLDHDHALQPRSAAYSVYGSALYFSGNTHQAQDALRRAVQLAKKTGERRARIYALGYLALISAEQGHLADAERHIRRASGSNHDLADGEHFMDAMVSLAAALILDMRSDTAAALTAADMAVISARHGGAILEVAKALAIKANILTHLGDHHSATTILEQADTLLRGCPDPDTTHTIGTTAAPHPGVPTTAHTQADTVGADLTSKELEVLRLLTTRLSRREIGQRLYISLNTVKSHQRALYRKLGAQNRNQAIKHAQQLGLL